MPWKHTQNVGSQIRSRATVPWPVRPRVWRMARRESDNTAECKSEPWFSAKHRIRKPLYILTPGAYLTGIPSQVRIGTLFHHQMFAEESGDHTPP